MAHYIQSDGPSIQERGREAVKEPHPVYLVESDAPFSVSTNEGTLNGNPGDYIAYDPVSGHIWPVSAEYVDMHYVFTGEGESLPSLEREATLQAENERLQQELADMQQAKALAEQALQEYEQAHTAEVAKNVTQAEQVAEAEQTQEAEQEVQ